MKQTKWIIRGCWVIAATYGLAACGGQPTADGDAPLDGDPSDPMADDDDAPSPSSSTPGNPTPNDPIIPDLPEPEPPEEPDVTPDDMDPCEVLTCNAGQRCEVDAEGAGACVDNTCEELECTATELCEGHELGGYVCVDNTCDEDVDCAPEEFCGASMMCEADVCSEEALSCSGENVLQCSSSGSEEAPIFSCESPAYFTSMCVAGSPDATGCTCEDDWDCPAFTTCEVGLCQGTGTEPTCTLPAVAFADTPPTVEIHWGGDATDADAAHDGSVDQTPAPWAEFSHIQSTPMVINLDDDNGDGLVNELDFPEIVFVTYSADDDNAILRAIHGGGPNKGKDMFALCGNTTWNEAAPFDTTTAVCDTDEATGADIPSRNAPAAADLDGDGLPEIVVTTRDGAVRILSNQGETIFLSEDDLIDSDPGSNNNWGTAPSIADIDHERFPEIIIGRYVMTLNISEGGAVAADAGVTMLEAGQLYIEHVFQGDLTAGLHGIMGPTSCIADVHPDAGLEVLAGATLYRMPALTECAAPPCLGALEVVWDGEALNPGIEEEGYCAVADVWGADAAVAPGPDNPPDGRAEAILINNGFLLILDGETGSLIHERDLEDSQQPNDFGGAPNVDDFDGDGFMEIASALRNYYIVIDLQDPTDNCPAWPTTMDRVVMDGVEDNPNLTDGLVRDPGAACADSSECNAGAVCNVRRGECVCLHNSWQRDSDDDSSRVTSSSVFDFNGDGAAEVLYNDECDFRVYDGLNGDVLYSEISRSRTAMENPVVADVDNDGNAEAVTILNTEQNGRCDDDDADPVGPNGLRVWGDPLDTWVSARRIWNQFAYHVTNVTEGGAVPVHEPESWVEYNGRLYNTYRSQPRNFGVAPDLQVTAVSVSSPDVACGELGDTLEIAFEITNAGDLRVGPGVEVSFYGVWDDMEAVLMGPAGPLTYTIMGSLEPDRSLIGSVLFEISDQGEDMLPTSVRVEVDTGGAADSDFGAERECIEDNNDASADVTPGEPRPDLSISLGAADVNCSTRIATVEVTVTNSGTADATGVVVEIFAGDPAAGGSSMAVIPLDDPIPAMESVTFTAEVENFPQNREITLWGTVDPNNTIEECNEADNSDPADNPIICSVPRTAR